MTLEVGSALGNFIGEFISFDPKNRLDFWKSYMRIRVRVDVRKPLRRGKKIRQSNGVIAQARFKYERLTVFCFFCGLLGHADDRCEKLWELNHDNGERGWSVDLRVERRKQGTASSCPWLREDGGPAVAGASNSQRQGPGNTNVNNNGMRGNQGNLNESMNGGSFFNINNNSNQPLHNGNAAIFGINLPTTSSMVPHVAISQPCDINPITSGLAGATHVMVQSGTPSLAAAPIHSIPNQSSESVNTHVASAGVRATLRQLRGPPTIGMSISPNSEIEDIEERKRKRRTFSTNTGSHTDNASNSTAVHFLSASPGSQDCREQ